MRLLSFIFITYYIVRLGLLSSQASSQVNMPNKKKNVVLFCCFEIIEDKIYFIE